MTPAQKQARQNIRNFLMVADIDQLENELAYAKESGDGWRVQCVRELIVELYLDEMCDVTSTDNFTTEQKREFFIQHFAYA